MIYGAGAGGIGVAQAIYDGLIREGLSHEEAKVRIFVFDSKGLLLDNRKLDAYKVPFAHSLETFEEWEYKGDQPSIEEVIRQAGVTCMLGLSGQPVHSDSGGSSWYTTIHIVQSFSASPIQPASLKVYLVISYLGQTEKRWLRWAVPFHRLFRRDAASISVKETTHSYFQDLASALS